MNEYISREATIEALDSRDEYDDLVNTIREQPPADVQLIKRGRWVDYTFYDPYEKSYEQNFEYKCSCCGHMIYNKPNDDNRYCGHCGARMDLKDGDTE